MDQEKAGGEKKRMLQMWLDQNQYSRKGILRYEAIFGRTYVSVGGEETTKDFCSQLCLAPGMKVLDIGCGTGGSAFYMARRCFLLLLPPVSQVWGGCARGGLGV